jgi:hypothetical protein
VVRVLHVTTLAQFMESTKRLERTHRTPRSKLLTSPPWASAPVDAS